MDLSTIPQKGQKQQNTNTWINSKELPNVLLSIINPITGKEMKIKDNGSIGALEEMYQKFEGTDYGTKGACLQLKVLSRKNTRFFIPQPDNQKWLPGFPIDEIQSSYFKNVPIKKLASGENTGSIVTGKNNHLGYLHVTSDGSFTAGNVFLIVYKMKGFVGVECINSGKAYVDQTGNVVFPAYENEQPQICKFWRESGMFKNIKLEPVRNYKPAKPSYRTILKPGEAMIDFYSIATGRGTATYLKGTRNSEKARVLACEISHNGKSFPMLRSGDIVRYLTVVDTKIYYPVNTPTTFQNVLLGITKVEPSFTKNTQPVREKKSLVK